MIGEAEDHLYSCHTLPHFVDKWIDFLVDCINLTVFFGKALNNKKVFTLPQFIVLDFGN